MPSSASRATRHTPLVGAPEAGLAVLGIASAVVSLLPRQTFTQYFMIPLLLFVLASAPIWTQLIRGRLVLTGRAAAIAILIAYISVLVFPQRTRSVGLPFPKKGPSFTLDPRELVRRLCGSGQEQQFEPTWSLETIRRLSDELRKNTDPDDLVFSTWQGFTFLAGRRDLPGNENFNARTVTNQNILSPDQLRRLHVAPNDELLTALRQGKPKAIVIGFFGEPFYLGIYGVRDPRYRPFGFRNANRAYVLRPELLANYRLVTQISGPIPVYTHQLWVRKD